MSKFVLLFMLEMFPTKKDVESVADCVGESGTWSVLVEGR